MKTITYKKGEYAQFKLDNGSKFFLETLPNTIRIKKVVLGFIPTKTLWTHKLSFYIRTATGAWATSEEILDLVLQELSQCNNYSDFEKILNPVIENYIKEKGGEAKNLAIEKLGNIAFKAKE
jgi:hypothetical protein